MDAGVWTRHDGHGAMNTARMNRETRAGEPLPEEGVLRVPPRRGDLPRNGLPCPDTRFSDWMAEREGLGGACAG